MNIGDTMQISRYNFIKKIGNEDLFFNSNTCALAIVNDDFKRVIDDIKKGVYKEDDYDPALIAAMKKSGCILEDDIDELKLIEFERNANKYQQTTLGLTITPTLDCNFRCTYCFENHIKGLMSEKTQEALVSFVEKYSSQVNLLKIVWFGGEPMLCKDLIFKLTIKFKDICKKNNIKYVAIMISNGSLIKESDINALKLADINNIQITIDGPPEIHNARRKTISGEDSFEKIITTVNDLLNNGINASIRINIDKENMAKTYDLFYILKERIDRYRDLNIAFGKLTKFTEVCNLIEGHCYSTMDFELIKLKLYERLIEMGFDRCKMKAYPKRRFNSCGADMANSFVVDVDGNLFKCWNQAGCQNENCGNVFDGLKIGSKNFLSWVQWSPLDYPECRECKVLPLCMGSCPNYEGDTFHSNSGKERNVVCEAIRYNMDDVLTFYYKLLRKKA